jgi:hypothetical protein
MTFGRPGAGGESSSERLTVRMTRGSFGCPSGAFAGFCRNGILFRESDNGMTPSPRTRVLFRGTKPGPDFRRRDCGQRYRTFLMIFSSLYILPILP